MKILNLYAGLGGNRKLWSDVDGELTDVSDIEDFIQQLLDQRDKEIIGKLSSIKPDGIISLASNTNPDEDVSTQKFQAFEYGYRVAVHQAISTIKETRKK